MKLLFGLGFIVIGVMFRQIGSPLFFWFFLFIGVVGIITFFTDNQQEEITALKADLLLIVDELKPELRSKMTSKLDFSILVGSQVRIKSTNKKAVVVEYLGSRDYIVKLDNNETMEINISELSKL